MRPAAVLPCLLISAAVSALAAQSQPSSVPVMVGGSPTSVACPGTGEVMGLDPKGDSFLSVRSGPGGSRFREIDRVYTGQDVHICAREGTWLGIVYDHSGKDLDCLIKTRSRFRAPYNGPCRSGWVHKRYVGNAAARQD